MKKIFLALFIMVCATTFARNPLKIINSKVAFRTFLQEKASANLVIDWTNAKYDNKKQFADEFNEDDDYAFIQKDCAEKFIEGFNAKSKGMKMENGKEDTTYKFVIAVRNMDASISPMGFTPGQTKSKMWGNLKIIDNASGDTIAEIEIDEVEDGTDYIRRESFGKTFMILGTKVAKLK